MEGISLSILVKYLQRILPTFNTWTCMYFMKTFLLSDSKSFPMKIAVLFFHFKLFHLFLSDNGATNLFGYPLLGFLPALAQKICPNICAFVENCHDHPLFARRGYPSRGFVSIFFVTENLLPCAPLKCFHNSRSNFQLL